MQMLTEQEIIKEIKDKYILAHNGAYNIKGIKNNELLHNSILSYFPEDNNKELKELIFLLYYPDLINKCYNPDCNNETKFINNVKGYNQFCCKDCQLKILNLSFNKRIELIEYKDVIKPLSKKEIKEKIEYSKIGSLSQGFITKLGVYEDTYELALSLYKETKFLDKEASIRERIYCIQNDINEKVKCNQCNNFVKFHKDKYAQTCSRSCQAKDTLYERKTTLVNKYGADNPSKIKEFQNKKIETNLNRRSVEQPFQSKEVQQKMKNTWKEKYDVENPSKSILIKNRIKETHKKNWGVDNVSQCDLIKKKKEETNLKNCGYSVNSKTKEWKVKVKASNIKKYNIDWFFKTEEFLMKSKKTNLEKYGYENPIKNKDVMQKSWDTKKRNKSIGSSKLEKDLYTFLKENFKDVKYQYKDSKRYPFYCDFYIEELDLFIEYQGYWTHGKEAFNIKNKEHLSMLENLKEKAKNSDHYKQAIKTWTIRDVKKREIAYQNKLNYLEIYDYDKNNLDTVLVQINRVVNNLKISSNNLHNEYKNIENNNKDYSCIPSNNYIVLNFNPHFYELENILYKNNPIIRRKLIENRIKYLDKKEYELTDRDLLRGFKISHIHKGFSFFSPFWIKKFIKDYSITSIYDPCGGWGHRLLGAYNIKYIYNDIDTRSYEGCKKISQDFNMQDKYFYNKDASNLQLEENYECVFTCPPYFDLEKYTSENSCTNHYNDYSTWLNTWWKSVVLSSSKNSTVRYFAYVIGEDYIEGTKSIILKHTKYKLKEQITIGPEYNFRSKKEYLVIFSL